MKSKKTFPIFLCISLVIASFACSASGGIPSLFATPTPTVTATFIPSPTPVPTNTPTLTPTATPSPTGVTSEEQPDGSTLVLDYDNNYKFILPAEWAVLPLASEDFAAILEGMAEENPELADIAGNFKALDSDAIRIVALNKNPKYVRDEFATNITVVVFEDKVMSAMPIEFITGAIEENFAGQGATVLTNGVNVKSTSNGIETGVIDVMQRTPTASGKQVEVLSRVVLFKTEGRLVMITLAVHKQFGDELLPVLDPILDSIDTLSP